MSIKELKLPELGEGVTEGELVKWLVQPGDKIAADQPVAELMTDKATVEVPAIAAGVVKELKFKSGDTVTVDSVLLTFEPGKESGGEQGQKTSEKNEQFQASAKGQENSKHQENGKAQAQAHSGGNGNGNGKSDASEKSQTKDVKLPELGEGVNEGELVAWKVKVGDKIKADQTIAELMTDKATVEVPSPVAGTVKELKFKVGDTVTVESTLIVLEQQGGNAGASTGATASSASTASSTSTPAPGSSPSVAAASSTPTRSSTQVPATQHSASGGSSAGQEIYPPAAESQVLATPATRRLARELSVDINAMNGTGIAGRVTREDVLRFHTDLTTQGGGLGKGAVGTGGGAPARMPAPYISPPGAEDERVPLKGIRKKIAQNLQMAKAIIPHFTLMDEANVTALVSLRESMKAYAEQRGTKITYLPIVMKALMATIREFPMFNASIDDQAEEIVYKKYFNIGFAADTPQGLVVPVIKNADHKSLLDISSEILDLSKRARDGKLKLEEMKGATITITNIGSVGGTYATPIINHPEVAILGMYKIQDRPIIEDGQLKAIKVMNFTITADHRLIDGAVAANFLKAFIGRLENPGQLMMEMY